MSEETRIAELIVRLADTYAELPSEQVVSVVNDALAHFNGAPLREYVPLLVERRARKELTNGTPLGLVVIAGPSEQLGEPRFTGRTAG
jgi:hypothetical protein